jgi:hypothetical protein
MSGTNDTSKIFVPVNDKQLGNLWTQTDRQDIALLVCVLLVHPRPGSSWNFGGFVAGYGEAEIKCRHYWKPSWTHFIIIWIFNAFLDPKQGNYLFYFIYTSYDFKQNSCRTVNWFLLYITLLYIFIARSNRYRTFNMYIFFSYLQCYFFYIWRLPQYSIHE